jgi:hypothetical protein
MFLSNSCCTNSSAAAVSPHEIGRPENRKEQDDADQEEDQRREDPGNPAPVKIGDRRFLDEQQPPIR